MHQTKIKEHQKLMAHQTAWGHKGECVELNMNRKLPAPFSLIWLIFLKKNKKIKKKNL